MGLLIVEFPLLIRFDGKQTTRERGVIVSIIMITEEDGRSVRETQVHDDVVPPALSEVRKDMLSRQF